ncbi:hypothetical protein GCM10011395_18090 [Sphingomonas psychrolutea]|uniref:Circumsporozoite protein n=2 Tax=Sphingomonas psychrolutea TaxID=1259676 RepID=A0ABQ1GPZ3_9SPHN|nr:hypothetical protein GCM10011395_18090 [Sphingomonas psychrolutea]
MPPNFAAAVDCFEPYLLLGSNCMKKIVLVLVAAGLVSLAACNKNPEAAAIENNADMMADGIDNSASAMDQMADNSSNAMASDMMENKADAMRDTADNVRDAGEAKADNVTK